MKYILLFLFSTSAFAQVFGKQLKMDGFRLEVNNLYHYQTAFFDDNGTTQNLNPGDDFFFIHSDLAVFWGLNDSFTLFGGGGIRYVSSESTSQSVTNMDLENFMFGVRVQFKDLLSMMGNLEVRYKQKAYSNNFFNPGNAPLDDLVLGNDGTFYQIGLNLTKQLSDAHLLQLSSAYVITPDYLSDQVDFDIQYLYKSTSFNLGFGVMGIYSLKDHPFSSAPSTRPVVSRGATRYFNGVNQEELSPYAQLGFKVSELSITTRASKTLSGIDTDEAFRLGVQLSVDIEGKDNTVERDSLFKEYSNSAKVIQVAPRGNFFKINQGLSTNVEKGMTVDIYQSDFFGGNVLVGSGVVFSAESDTSVIKVIKFDKKIPIKEGFIVRMQ